MRIRGWMFVRVASFGGGTCVSREVRHVEEWRCVGCNTTLSVDATTRDSDLAGFRASSACRCAAAA